MDNCQARTHKLLEAHTFALHATASVPWLALALKAAGRVDANGIDIAVVSVQLALIDVSCEWKGMQSYVYPLSIVT